MARNEKGDYIELNYIDADVTKALYIQCGFVPSRAELLNETNADLPQVSWSSTMSSGNSADGGILLDKASSLTKTLLADTAGITTDAGGSIMHYNDATAATPTFKKDGVSFTDIVIDADGNNVLTDNFPTLTADDGRTYRLQPGLKLNAMTNARVTNDDDLVIRIWK
jgi:hypothetical protein